MRYRYFPCDVFTDTRFGGNPLAVLPEASGLSDRQMLQIAREFNLSETAFVFPPESGHTRKVRIFTPAGELPFAGHPNVGTAFVLATTGVLGELRSSLTVRFEEIAGVVPIGIEVRPGERANLDWRVRCPGERGGHRGGVRFAKWGFDGRYFRSRMGLRNPS